MKNQGIWLRRDCLEKSEENSKNIEKVDVRISCCPALALRWNTQEDLLSSTPGLRSRKVYTYDLLNWQRYWCVEVPEILLRRESSSRRCLSEGTLTRNNPRWCWGKLLAAPCCWLPCTGEAPWGQEPGAGEATHTAGGGHLRSNVHHWSHTLKLWVLQEPVLEKLYML